MKAKQTATMIIVAAFILAASSALAGPGQWGGRGSGGWGMDTPYQRLYDPAKEETFSGEVIGLEQTTPMRRMNQGMALIIKTDQETVTVHLGPSWYLERLDTRISVGDKVQVTGSRATVAGKPVVLASEVKKGEDTLVLRDDSGIPVWAGWGRRRG